jgi:hypothetical protein
MFGVSLFTLSIFETVSWFVNLQECIQVWDHFFLLGDFMLVFMQHRTYEDIAHRRPPRHWKYQGMVPVLVHLLPLWFAIILTLLDRHRFMAQLMYIVSYLAAFPLARRVGGRNRSIVSAGYMSIATITIMCALTDYDPIHLFRLTQSHILTRSSVPLYQVVLRIPSPDAYTCGQLTGGIFGCWYAFNNWILPLLWVVLSIALTRLLPGPWLDSVKSYPYESRTVG